jgi:hypothetical protein
MRWMSPFWLGANRMRPGPHVAPPPKAVPVETQLRAGPPVTGISFSSPPAKKPTDRLSGDQNGSIAPSVPSRAMVSCENRSVRKSRRLPLSRAAYTSKRPSGDISGPSRASRRMVAGRGTSNRRGDDSSGAGCLASSTIVATTVAQMARTAAASHHPGAWAGARRHSGLSVTAGDGCPFAVVVLLSGPPSTCGALGGCGRVSGAVPGWTFAVNRYPCFGTVSIQAVPNSPSALRKVET